MSYKHDWLVVGAGAFGATFAKIMSDSGRRVLVIDKRNHIAGNCYTESKGNIDIHKYGPHIFHTSNLNVWQFVNRFADFNNFINRPKVNYRGDIFSFPINLFTLYQLFGVRNPTEARQKLKEIVIPSEEPWNLEEYALSKVGLTIFEKFIKGYTEKQWGRDCSQLPAEILKRIPIRLTYDDNYFMDKYQGIPVNGYTQMFDSMLQTVEVRLGEDYLSHRAIYDSMADRVLYTGAIDEFFDYCHEPLEYRSLRFETQVLEGVTDFQGNAVVNYTAPEVPFTRIVEHKHFNMDKSAGQPTIITHEYPEKWEVGKERFYPVRNVENKERLLRYQVLAKEHSQRHFFGGRLGNYIYWNMDQAIASAMTLASKFLTKQGLQRVI